ncbi:MAG: molybdopterin molybdotransferase MoeA [Candidatus Marinimicrobia bacterium]|jgi:molybdopterin molybdotransferase|nr:molybdopterin molybdotransferase MoeA [Candidatus Neomarinimicrobiota bacterium]MDP6853680.1 molybdopterin molybdotransferase MoeA [Candidatus Neomarinimicrobiota bacterium]MDP6937024.1 molybdopterin molybdotransferase MoeA [Candidatus Neomarinimicrobiota bacterium]
MIPVHEAKTIIKSFLNGTGSEIVNLDKAGGRILYECINADFPMPRFDNSAMDGFAVKAIDTMGASKENPLTLKMVGASYAGKPFEGSIQSGECTQCMTGAMIPKGADAIVIVEQSSGFSDKEMVQIYSQTRKGNHIRIQGEEVKENTLLIEKGKNISAGELGILAAFGFGEVNVARRPAVALFSTGNELVEPGKSLAKGQIYNSNMFVLGDMIKSAGGKIVLQDVISDDKSSLKTFITSALNQADIIISSGGISMGRGDYVRSVLIESGVQEHFWKVNQKPGKPLFFGTADTSLIFGLPGNPVSSFICFQEYIDPVIREIQQETPLPPMKATLTDTFSVEKSKHRFRFGKYWINLNGKIMCSAFPHDGSHMLTSSLDANCILEAPPGEFDLVPGDEITMKRINWRN